MDIATTAEFLLDAFETLGRRELAGGALDAMRIPGRKDAFVAVSAAQEFHILLEVGPDTVVEERRLNALHVLSGDNFTIVDVGSEESIQRRFALVLLRQGHIELAESFAVVAATLMATLPESPTAREIVDFMDSLLELVAPSRIVNEKTVVGLWGELWMIVTSTDPGYMAAAWHSKAMDRFDFSLLESWVEVKTTQSTVRSHEFSLAQLASSSAKPTLIASLAVVQDPTGKTVIDLLDEVLPVLSGPLARRVSRIVLETLSGDIEATQDFAFTPYGPDPLRVHDAQKIPRPLVGDPSTITGVRFTANLEEVEALALPPEGLVSLLRTVGRL